GLRRGQNFPSVVQVDLRNLGFNLAFDLVRCALELVERFADLAANLGELLGPEDDQRHKEDENHLWKTQVHDCIINGGAGCQQSGKSPYRGVKRKSAPSRGWAHPKRSRGVGSPRQKGVLPGTGRPFFSEKGV